MDPIHEAYDLYKTCIEMPELESAEEYCCSENGRLYLSHRYLSILTSPSMPESLATHSYVWEPSPQGLDVQVGYAGFAALEYRKYRHHHYHKALSLVLLLAE